VHLLSRPAELPKAQRTSGTDGKAAMTGAQCQTSMTELYSVAGDIRGQLLSLQWAVIFSQQEEK